MLRKTKPPERSVFLQASERSTGPACRECEFKGHKDTRNVGKSVLQKGERAKLCELGVAEHTSSVLLKTKPVKHKLALSSDSRNKRKSECGEHLGESRL